MGGMVVILVYNNSDTWERGESRSMRALSETQLRTRLRKINMG
jgi:hypothetical protein